MLINLSAWLQPTHTFHLPRKEKSLPFSSTHLGLASFSLWRQEVFTFRRAFLITLVSLSHFMEEKTEAGSRGRDSSGLSPLILLVRVNHSLIWGSHRAPNRQEIHLHWLSPKPLRLNPHKFKVLRKKKRNNNYVYAKISLCPTNFLMTL